VAGQEQIEGEGRRKVREEEDRGILVHNFIKSIKRVCNDKFRTFR
jgi:hypothetical protein